MGPKQQEDPEDKKNRLRERRQSLLERRDSAETSAGGLTSDLRAVYGLSGLSMFGMKGKSKGSTATSTPKISQLFNDPGK